MTEPTAPRPDYIQRDQSRCRGCRADIWYHVTVDAATWHFTATPRRVP